MVVRDNMNFGQFFLGASQAVNFFLRIKDEYIISLDSPPLFSLSSCTYFIIQIFLTLTAIEKIKDHFLSHVTFQ